MPAIKMTTIHVSTETGWRGGEKQVKLLTDGLMARGHKCIVLCPQDSPLFRDRNQAGVAQPLRFWGELDVLAAYSLAQLARKNHAHLIHAHTSHAHSLAWIASAWAHIPFVVSRRVDFPVGGNRLSRRKYFSARVRYIAISEAVKRVLIRSGISENRICVVRSGVDAERQPFRGGARDETAARALGSEPGELLILNVAALTDHKDQATLLHAMALLREEHRRVRLVIAGSGELESELKQLAAELGIAEHVLFAGYVSDLKPLYRAADLFVMSSHMEGLCTSIIDAMLAGVPVVATRAGGIPELVTHDETGLLAPPRNPEALASAISDLLDAPERGAQMAAAARENMLSNFTADGMVEGTMAAYKRILAESAALDPD